MGKLMDFDNIKIGLARVQSLVEGWENAGVTELERDLALEELRRIYTEIRFGGAAVESAQPAAETAAVVVPPVAAEAPASAEDVADEEESDEPEIEVELIMPDEEESEEDEEPTEAEQEQAAEPEQSGQEEAVAEEPEEIQSEEPAAEEPEQTEENVEQTEEKPEEPEDKPVEDTVVEIEDTAEDTVKIHSEIRNTEQSLFGDEEVIRPRSSRRRVIMSLYDDDMPIIIPESKPEPMTQPEPAKDIAAEPVKEQPEEHLEQPVENPAPAEQHSPVAATADSEETVLGDVLRADVHTLGDSIARPKGIAESAPVASLRTAIGINDRFLLIRDLFDNDAIEYEKAIVALDSFDNLDDCMIHIVENYSWRSSSDGAKLIMDLIQRKFRK